MKFTYASGIHQLKTTTNLYLTIDKSWIFFSSPKNLPSITPKKMNFIITSNQIDKTYTGQIITYKVSILPLVKTNWITEITAVSKNNYFIDEQRFGPYKMWHHEHRFEEIDNGTRMTDIINFKLPFGIFGNILFKLFIKKQLIEIFNYRQKKLNSLFTKESI